MGYLYTDDFTKYSDEDLLEVHRLALRDKMNVTWTFPSGSPNVVADGLRRIDNEIKRRGLKVK